MIKQNCKCYFRKYAWDKLWQYGKPRQFGKIDTRFVFVHNGQEVQKSKRVIQLTHTYWVSHFQLGLSYMNGIGTQVKGMAVANEHLRSI